MPPETYKIYSNANLQSRLAHRLRAGSRRDFGNPTVTGCHIGDRGCGGIAHHSLAGSERNPVQVDRRGQMDWSQEVAGGLRPALASLHPIRE